MHVGVLLKIKANTKEEARSIANAVLFDESYCFREVGMACPEREDYSSDEAYEKAYEKWNAKYWRINGNALWDYPYSIKDNGDYFYDGETEHSKVISGMSLKEFLEHKYTKSEITRTFEFVGNDIEVYCSSSDIDDLWEDTGENTWFFIGTVHI